MLATESRLKYGFIDSVVQQCSAAVVQLILLKPLKSNFLQFLEEAWTGRCIGDIP